MAVKYPTGPAPPESIMQMTKVNDKDENIAMTPGEGINAAPFEAESFFDFTLPQGSGTGMIYGLVFQLGKWGYNVEKHSTSINVSPVFTEYYQKTIEEKKKLEEQMKSGFASLTTAVSDFELLEHDLRKYKEYLNYFSDVEKAKTDIEKAEKSKNKDDIAKGKETLKRAKHVLKAMFVDLVDANTGEGISMKSIAVRWPTIITDFMTLSEDYNTPDDIVKALGGNISKAEATILATKCQLFKTWMEYFFDNVKERYVRLKSMSESRKKSIDEYRNALKPTIARYKDIRDAKELKVTQDNRLYYYRPDAQAISIDAVTIWAWRPFISPDLFRATRETYDNVTFKEAGFYNLAKYFVKDEAQKKKIIEQIKVLEKEKRGLVPALPALPIIDRPLIAIIKQIEKEYNVVITPGDIYKIIENMAKKFVPPVRPEATGIGIRWPFSPYFIFVEMMIERTVIKMPNGAVMEDIVFLPLKTYNATQNIILGRMLELSTKTNVEEREIMTLLGLKIEMKNSEGESSFVDYTDIGIKDYPDVFGKKKTDEEKKEEEKKKVDLSIPGNTMSEAIEEFGMSATEFFKKLGIDVRFFYYGPYEKFMAERMSKMMQLGPGRAFNVVAEYLKKAAGVPGAEPKVWI